MEKIHNLLQNYLSEKNSFELSELIDFLMEQQERVIPDLSEIRDWVYKERNFFYGQGFFVRKKSFFQDAEFLIKPTALEIEQGYLIPGHRWHPFISRDLKPWDVKLLDFSGNPVLKKQKAIEIEALKSFHLLLGDEPVFDDCQIKSSLFGQFYAEFPHYDLQQIVGFSQLNDSSCIRCRVEDYTKGIIRVLAIEPIRDNPQWDMMMEEALIKVIERFGLSLSLPEQIEWALFLGHSDLRYAAGKPLASIINQNVSLDFYKIGLTTVLWKNDGSIEHALAQTDPFSKPDLMVKEGEKFISEMIDLFHHLSPFTRETLGAIESWSISYLQQYQQCLENLAERPLAPMGKESQLFLTITQYSNCLMSTIKEMSTHPPSKEEMNQTMKILLETEEIFDQILPYISGCRVSNKTKF